MSTRTPLFLASDNIVGCHPSIINDFMVYNTGSSIPYGGDPASQTAKELIQSILGIDSGTDVAFVVNGTAANILGISSVVLSTEAVIASDSSHIWADEAGAFEHFSGCRIIPIQTDGEKIGVWHIEDALLHFPMHGSIHKVRPKVVSISQTTEFGLIYTPHEIRELAEYVHDKGMLLHVDGSRLSNAAAVLGSFQMALGGGPSCDSYVDILSFGAIKNGGMFGEAVVFMGRAKGAYSIQKHKQALNLTSKQRYIASQFHTLYGTDLWKRNAERANFCAKELERLLKQYGGIRVHFHLPVESNAIFISFPEKEMDHFLQLCSCYIWNQKKKIVRLMTSWATTDEDLMQFEEIVQEVFA